MGVGEVMSFKGDNINGFDLKDRKWNPERLLQGYFHSAATLNFLRAYTMSADPMALCKIKLTALQSSPKFEAMQTTAREIGAKYMSSAPVEFFTAHEAMQLDLEEALTRPVGDKYYNLSAHPLDWRPHTAARQCPCRVLQGYLQPHRLQDWTLDEGRGASGVGEGSES